jgi:putative FmdB family regulatory protein
MPLYEYFCSDCRAKFELLVTHQHADDIVCTRCHGEKVKRLLSTFAFAGKSGSTYDDYDSSASSGGSCGCGDGGCGCH